jgi:hypothetical protein
MTIIATATLLLLNWVDPTTGTLTAVSGFYFGTGEACLVMRDQYKIQYDTTRFSATCTDYKTGRPVQWDAKGTHAVVVAPGG